MPTLLILAAAATLTCTVVDGDTLRCGDERVRLIGIDAPELPGHCRPGRDCAPGDPFESKAALERMVQDKRLTIERHGTDRYGRTLAYVSAGTVDLSCAMLRQGQAIYVKRWDMEDRLGRCAR